MTLPTSILRRFSLLLGVFLVVSGCEQTNPETDLPIFLNLSGYKIKTDNQVIGERNIKDYWIDHNGETMGIHRVPRVIPLLPQEDRNELTIRGGIFQNGLTVLPAPYPFWEPITLQIEADPLDTVDLDLTFQYWPRDSILIYPFEEDFEGGGAPKFVSNDDLTNPTRLEPSALKSYQGQWSGRVIFTSSQYNFEALSSNFLSLPRTNDNNVYLEITYQNTIPFTVGLFYTNVNATNVQELPLGVAFLSEDKWTTAYIHLQSLVQSVEPGFFKLYLKATGDNGDGEIQTGNIYLDYMRIIHFK